MTNTTSARQNDLQEFFATQSWLAPVLALLGGLVYLFQSWGYLHTLDSILDEGAYLLKGLLFVRKVYTPFQDYGPLTNHMPLPFLTYGFVQEWFGAGIRTARYFALSVGVLGLIGLWITARRVGGEWWAAAAVWAIALNPAVIKMYSVATSQVLVFGLLVWVLVFGLGGDRKFWQVIVASILMGILMMYRINLIPALPLFILYLLWQHGWRTGTWAALAGFGTLLALHALWWPGVLRMWAYWGPESLSPFLEPWREPDAVRWWNPQTGLDGRILSLFHGFRFHFIAFAGTVLAWLVWPHKVQWDRPDHFKSAVFLSLLFTGLALIHAYATFGLEYCVFCFPVYLAFFDWAGLLLLILILPRMRAPLSPARQVAISLFILLLLTGMAYSAFSEFGESLLKIPVPRIRSFQIQPGTVELWGLLSNRFGLTYPQLLRILPALTGFLLGLLFLALAEIAYRLLKPHPALTSYGKTALLLTLGAGFLFSPTRALGDGFQTYDCTPDILQSYEAGGAHLANLIPPGSEIYWQASLSAVPLLYTTDLQLHPSQINLGYSLYLTGDDDALERYGFWSNPLGQKWIAQADYALVINPVFEGWVAEALTDSTRYRELPPTPPLAPCDPEAYIRIFERIR